MFGKVRAPIARQSRAARNDAPAFSRAASWRQAGRIGCLSDGIRMLRLCSARHQEHHRNMPQEISQAQGGVAARVACVVSPTGPIFAGFLYISQACHRWPGTPAL